MDIIHIFFKFQNQSSLAYITRIATRSMITFEKMKEGIGTTIDYFDKEQNVHLKLKVIEVRQATHDDYEKSNQYVWVPFYGCYNQRLNSPFILPPPAEQP
jgi:hypothetical protein